MELVVVGQLVQLVAVDPALLNAKLVHDGPHQRLGPLTIGLPVPQSVVQVEEPMVTCTRLKSIDNNAFSGDKIKSTFCIQKEKENWLFKRVDGEVHTFCQKQSSKFVARSRALELCLSLSLRPTLRVQVANVPAQGLGHQGAGRDRPVRPVGLAILAMSFPKNAGPDSVELLEGGGVDLGNEDIEEETKMLQFLEISMEEVGVRRLEIVRTRFERI